MEYGSSILMSVSFFEECLQKPTSNGRHLKYALASYYSRNRFECSKRKALSRLSPSHLRTRYTIAQSAICTYFNENNRGFLLLHSSHRGVHADEITLVHKLARRRQRKNILRHEIRSYISPLNLHSFQIRVWLSIAETEKNAW